MRRNLHAGKKSSGGFSLNAFTEDELYDIHLGTLEVMEKTGVFVEDEEALEVLDGGGAKVDRASKVVRFPPHVVEDAIRAAPSKICLAGRSPEFDFVVEGSRIGFTNFGEGIQVVDPYTGELREPTKRDAADTARIVDYLSDIDVYERAVGPHDVPQEVAPLHLAEVFLTNCRKHIVQGPLSGRLARKIIEMQEVVLGGKDEFRDRPLITFLTCPVSPLRLVRDCCEIIMEASRSGAAVNVLSMAMAGGSSPVTLAGTLVTHNAEVLAGLVLSQLTRKGTPVIYGSSTTCMDLRTATAAVGSPELAMINAGVAQLARYYLLPSWVAGGQADSKISDAQVGHEKTLSLLLTALAGANLIYGLGMFEMGVTFDFGQLVMDHEFARNVKHVVQGIPVTDETLAIDVIGEVGPFRDFLSHDHTFRHMKTQSQARLIDRRMRGDWEAAGGTTIYERATEEARSILESHQPAPLPDNTVAALRSMVEEAEREFGATRAG